MVSVAVAQLKHRCLCYKPLKVCYCSLYHMTETCGDHRHFHYLVHAAKIIIILCTYRLVPGVLQYVMFQAVLLEDPSLLSSSSLKACLFYPVSPLPGFFPSQSPCMVASIKHYRLVPSVLQYVTSKLFY